MKISKKSAGILAAVLVITSGFFAYALLSPNGTKQMDAMDHSGMGHGGSATAQQAEIDQMQKLLGN